MGDIVGNKMVCLVLILPHANTDPSQHVGDDCGDQMIVLPHLRNRVVGGVMQYKCHLLVSKSMQESGQNYHQVVVSAGDKDPQSAVE